MNAESNNVTPDVRHFAGLADAYTLCGLERATVRWTDDPATPVDCPACTTALAAEVPVCLAWSRHGGICGQPAPCDGSRHVEPAPAVTERRTVSLERLTDELRALAAQEYTGDNAVILEGATVGIVGRIGGRADAVTDVDSDWFRSGIAPGQVLASMMQQARGRAQSAGAELLMPTPDVLAALDGRPDATFWTAPVPVMHRDMQPGWLLISYADEGDSVPAGTERQELIEAITDCTPELADGVHAAAYATDCRVLTVGGQPCHFDNWLTNLVRIPAAVTR